MTNVEEKLPPMTKGRLVEIFERSQQGEAGLGDVLEILSKMFLSQAQFQRASQKREEDTLSEITNIKKRLSLLEQFAGSPLYSTVLEDLGEIRCDRCGDLVEVKSEEGDCG